MAPVAISVSQRPTGCGWRAASVFSVSSGSMPPGAVGADAGAHQSRRQFGDLLLRVTDLAQQQIDRRIRSVADQVAQRLVAFVDLVAGQQRSRLGVRLRRSEQRLEAKLRAARGRLRLGNLPRAARRR